MLFHMVPPWIGYSIWKIWVIHILVSAENSVFFSKNQLMWPTSHCKNTKVGRLSQIFRTFVLKFGCGEVEGGGGLGQFCQCQDLRIAHSWNRSNTFTFWYTIKFHNRGYFFVRNNDFYISDLVFHNFRFSKCHFIFQIFWGFSILGI